MRQIRPHLPSARGTLLAVLLATLGVVAIGANPAAAAADTQVSWAIRTASNDLGADRQNYDYSLDPGGSISDGIMVANHGKKDLDLRVYAADGFTSDSGQLDLETADKLPTGVGAWLASGQSTVKVPAGKTVEVPFTVTLPKNATPGDHVGGIITSLRQPDDTDGINVDRRLAMRVHLRVGGELAPALKVEDLHVDYSGTVSPFAKGDATVGYTIHNTGNAIVTAKQAASVSGPFGTFRVKADTIDDSPALLPGETWKVEVPLSGVVPSVRVAASVTLSPIVTDASGSVSPLRPVEASSHAWALPWSALVVLLVLIALVVVATRSRRRRLALEQERLEAAVAEALRERETADQ